MSQCTRKGSRYWLWLRWDCWDGQMPALTSETKETALPSQPDHQSSLILTLDV